MSYLKPLEWAINKEEHNGTMHREDNVCYVKMICVLSQKEKVVGLHYLGPNAGEVMQVKDTPRIDNTPLSCCFAPITTSQRMVSSEGCLAHASFTPAPGSHSARTDGLSLSRGPVSQKQF